LILVFYLNQYIEHHLIPNALMGYVGGANMQKIQIRLMFPRKAEGRVALQGSKMDKESMALFYNNAVRPAVTAALEPEMQGEWPLTATDEQFRATRINGQVTFTTRSIPSNYLDRFLKSMHEHTRSSEDIKWARDFFLQVQIQGCKQSTRHYPPPPFPASENPDTEDEERQQQEQEERSRIEDEFTIMRGCALMDAVSPLDAMAFDPRNWWVDIATTVHLADHGYSLLISTDRHDWLISHMTGLPVTDADRRIRRGAASGYAQDETAHLGVVSGFRLKVHKDQPTPLGVDYAQAYTTEKSLTALKDSGHFAKYTEPRKVFQNYPNVLKNHFLRLEKVFKGALEEEFVVDVRLESRTSWLHACDIHRHFPNYELSQCLVKVRTKDFW
jgi:hypothetical protein